MPPPALTPGGSGPPAAAAGEQPPTQVVQGGTGPPKCPVPSWASEPPSGSRLLVYKDGLVIQEVALTKASALVWAWGHGKWVVTLRRLHSAHAACATLAPHARTRGNTSFNARSTSPVHKYSLLPPQHKASAAILADPAASQTLSSWAGACIVAPRRSHLRPLKR